MIHRLYAGNFYAPDGISASNNAPDNSENRHSKKIDLRAEDLISIGVSEETAEDICQNQKRAGVDVNSILQKIHNEKPEINLEDDNLTDFEGSYFNFYGLAELRREEIFEVMPELLSKIQTTHKHSLEGALVQSLVNRYQEGLHHDEDLSISLYSLFKMNQAAEKITSIVEKNKVKELLQTSYEIIPAMFDSSVPSIVLDKEIPPPKKCLEDITLSANKISPEFQKYCAELYKKWDELAESKQSQQRDMQYREGEYSFPLEQEMGIADLKANIQQAVMKQQEESKTLLELRSIIDPEANSNREEAWTTAIETSLTSSQNHPVLKFDSDSFISKHLKGRGLELSKTGKFALSFLESAAQSGRTYWLIEKHELASSLEDYINHLERQAAAPSNAAMQSIRELEKFFSVSNSHNSFRDSIYTETNNLSTEILVQFKFLDELKKIQKKYNVKIELLDKLENSKLELLKTKRPLIISGPIFSSLGNFTYTVRHRNVKNTSLYDSKDLNNLLELVHKELMPQRVSGEHSSVATVIDDELKDFAAKITKEEDLELRSYKERRYGNILISTASNGPETDEESEDTKLFFESPDLSKLPIKTAFH